MSKKNTNAEATTAATRTFTEADVLAHKAMKDNDGAYRKDAVYCKIEPRIATLVKVFTDTDKGGGTAFQVSSRIVALGIKEYAKAKGWIFDEALLALLDTKTKKITPYLPPKDGDGDGDGDGV